MAPNLRLRAVRISPLRPTTSSVEPPPMSHTSTCRSNTGTACSTPRWMSRASSKPEMTSTSTPASARARSMKVARFSPSRSTTSKRSASTRATTMCTELVPMSAAARTWLMPSLSLSGALDGDDPWYPAAPRPSERGPAPAATGDLDSLPSHGQTSQAQGPGRAGDSQGHHPGVEPAIAVHALHAAGAPRREGQPDVGSGAHVRVAGTGAGADLPQLPRSAPGRHQQRLPGRRAGIDLRGHHRGHPAPLIAVAAIVGPRVSIGASGLAAQLPPGSGSYIAVTLPSFVHSLWKCDASGCPSKR